MKLSNKRCIQILQLLLKSKEKMTGDNLAISIGVSSRTIRNDMKELNRVLKEYSAEVISEIGHGYWLCIYDQQAFSILVEEIKEKERDFQNIIPSEPEDRMRYIISKLLLAALTEKKKIIEIYDLEEELFISYATLKKDFRAIDKVLEKYDLRISITKKQGIRIIGEEAKIRYCISEYIFNNKKYSGIEENEFYKTVFTEQEMSILRNVLIEGIAEYNLRLTDIAFQNILIHSLIMLKRHEQRRNVTYQQSDMEKFESSREFECAKQIIQKIEEKLGENLGDEVYYLTQHLISSQRFLINSPGDDYEYKAEIEEILQTIKDKMGIDLSDDKQLINGLAMHLRTALQRLRFEMNIRNEFLDEIKNLYPLAFELAVLAGEVIEEHYNFRATENEIGFLAIHLGAALERKGLNVKPKRKKVLIVCFAGAATGMILKEKIQRNFNKELEVVKTCSRQELTEEMVQQADIVLTTVDIPEISSSKIQKIKLFLEESDIEEIRGIIEKSSRKDDIDYEGIFKKDLFFVNMDARNKEEVLTKITNVMLEKGYISESVRQSIFKREEMATTELGSLVAIPHALLNDMEEAVVSVTILRKPILWEKEKVQVVLLLDIPKNAYGTWEKVFKKLYNYLIGIQGVTKLIKNKNYHEFINELKQI